MVFRRRLLPYRCSAFLVRGGTALRESRHRFRMGGHDRPDPDASLRFIPSAQLCVATGWYRRATSDESPIGFHESERFLEPKVEHCISRLYAPVSLSSVESMVRTALGGYSRIRFQRHRS